ncbi:MAG: hypothetical protein K6B71_01600 [Alphaproteobacteria bacterium]|nr:hypothetical protein [Alphaproteobacteria bacterium]
MEKNLQVSEVVKIVVADTLDLDYNERTNMTLDTNIVTEYGADSLDIPDIVIKVQKNLGINLSGDQETTLVANINIKPTISTIVNFMNGDRKSFVSTQASTQSKEEQKNNIVIKQKSSTSAIIKQIIEQHLDLPETTITIKTSLNTDHYVDSLDALEIAAIIDEQPGLKMTSKEYNILAHKIATRPIVAEVLRVIYRRKWKKQYGAENKEKLFNKFKTLKLNTLKPIKNKHK